jgi:L-amino acid N-acyltransferase YncA
VNVVVHRLVPSDWQSVAAIYASGIESGNATFETRLPDWEDWDAAHLSCCRLAARDGERIVGWAALSPVSRRECYRGVAEISVYVDEDYRGRGVGKALLEALVVQSEENGIWTLQASTLPDNVASLRLQTSCGFRIVGQREHIAQLHGVWRDTILTERRSRRIGLRI